MPSPRVLSLLAALAAAALLLPGCKRGARDGCLSNAPDCRVAPPCDALAFTCDSNLLEVRTLGPEDARQGGLKAQGARGDVLLGNGRVVAVISGIGHQMNLDPNGGTLMDLMPRGGTDGLNHVWQVAGILPEDAARYTSIELIDQRPARVAVQVRGTLAGHPDVPVSTRYELRPCDPGVRIRTELVNGTPDSQLWTVTDGFYWYGQSLPFSPQPGAGFTHPSFSLASVGDVYQPFPFLAAASFLPPQASYAEVGCNVAQLEGFHSAIISASGLPRSVVEPRDYQVYERFLAVADAKDVGGAASVALEARHQLFGEEYVTLSGHVARMGGDAAFSDSRQASVVVSEGTLSTDPSKRVPWSQVVPGPGGAFSARVPKGRDYLVEVFAYGQKVAEREVPGVAADTDAGLLMVPSTARVTLDVREAGTGRPLDAEVYVVAADEATRLATRGTFHGLYEECSPWLGPPPGGSPACNRVLTAEGQATFDVPTGAFHFYAFKGPFWTIQRKTVTLAPVATTVSLTLSPLPLQPAGTVSADLHVHGPASVDSSLPEVDRVRSFSAVEVPVIAATDHDVVHDYGAMVRQLGLQDRMTAIVGTETTGQILFLKSPGNTIPLVIGHYNFWPLAYDPTLPRNGGPQDEYLEPGELFDRVKPLFQGGGGVIQLNHPWAEPTFGRDLGFPRAIGLSALKDLPGSDDGTPQGLYVRAKPGGSANDSHDAQEVMNGSRNEYLLAYRALWFYLLNQGRPRTGTANSDSHGLHDSTVGSPRNVVYADTRPGPDFNQARFDAAVRGGALFGTNGPVIEATIDAAQGPRRFGMTPFTPSPGAKLHLKVSAAPWVPVEELRIIVNGEVRSTLTGLTAPADPFGTDGLVRFEGDVDLAPLLPSTGDAWLVVEAGTKLPLAADLGGPRGVPDGIPDTTDNNGDGVVDAADVDPGATFGPMKNWVPPTADSDPLTHFARVVPDGYPFAFTNPFVLDLDGNGRFEAPRRFAQK